MERIREELIIKDAFEIYLRATLQQEWQILQALLMLHNRASALLPGAVGDALSTRTLGGARSRHEITKDHLRACYELSLTQEEGSWSKLAQNIGNTKWKAITSNGLTLRKMFFASGFDIDEIEWHIQRGPRQHRVRNKRTLNPQTGRPDVLHSEKRTARPLLNTLSAALKADESLSLIARGRESEINKLHLKRTIRDTTSPSGVVNEAYTRQVLGRFVPISESLRYLLDNLVAQDVLSADVEHIRIAYWVDGSPLARLSTVLVRCRLLYHPRILRNDTEENLRKLRSIQTWITMPMDETYEDLRRVLTPLIAQELEELHQKETRFQLRFDLQLADNKFQGCSSGVGGDFPCDNCYCCRYSFSSYSLGPSAPTRSPLMTATRL